MKVFISWSGDRSKATAEILKRWIRQVIQSAEPWISSDIDKGSRWSDELNKELEQTRFGIICLNKGNLNSEWILFEAGALSKTTDAHVCTFLMDLKPADVKPPLGQFQHTAFEKDDIKKLLQTINNKIKTQGEKSVIEEDLNELFDSNWPKLYKDLTTIKETEIKEEVHRTDRELLEELLQLVRSQSLISAYDHSQELLLSGIKFKPSEKIDMPTHDKISKASKARKVKQMNSPNANSEETE